MMNQKHFIDEELLSLSGIQHFAFCERQWALIHVEQSWAENLQTVEGELLHEQVDDPYFTENRNCTKIVRSVPMVSRWLGLYGIADLLEYEDRPGTKEIRITLVEYKRGKPKVDDRDEVQLCAQAMCLEEMLGINLEYGYFYYGQTRHRYRVDFSKELRTRVSTLAWRMHKLFEQGVTPKAVKSKKCGNCSLVELCVPRLAKRPKVRAYLSRFLKEMQEESEVD